MNRCFILWTCLLVSLYTTGQIRPWEWMQPHTGLVQDIATDNAGYTYAVVYHSDSLPYGNTPWQPGRIGSVASYDPGGSITWSVPIINALYDRIAVKNDSLYAVGLCSPYVDFAVGQDTLTWNSPDGTGVMVSCFSTSGIHAWTHIDSTFGGTELFDVEANDAHEVFVAAKHGGLIFFNGDSLYTDQSSPLLLKYGAGGVPLWAAAASGMQKGGAHGVTTLIDGGAIITGFFAGDSCRFGTTLLTDGTFFLARADSAGQFMWAVDGHNAWPMDVDASADDSVFVCGSFHGSSNAFGPLLLQPQGTSMFLAKYDLTGNCGWVRRSYALDSVSYCEAARMCVDPEGYAYAGVTSYGAHQVGPDTLTGSLAWMEKVHPYSAHVWTAVTHCDTTNGGTVQVTGVGAGADGEGRMSGNYRYSALYFNNDSLPTPPFGNHGLLVGKTGAVIPEGTSALTVQPDIPYPNPVDQALYFRKPTLLDQWLVDQCGRQVCFCPAGSSVLPLAHVANGAYVLLDVPDLGALSRALRVIVAH